MKWFKEKDSYAYLQDAHWAMWLQDKEEAMYSLCKCCIKYNEEEERRNNGQTEQGEEEAAAR